MWSRRRPRPPVLALLALVLSTAAWCSGAWFLAAGAAGAAGTGPDLLLSSQSEWVTPAAPGSTATFDLDLTARNAPAGAQVEVLLYPRLDSRDHFEDVLSHGPRNSPISEATPIALDHLPADPHTPGGVEMSLQVLTTQSTGGGQQLGLACSGPTATGTCTGVYPMTVSLLDSSGVMLHRFTTFLTYASGPSATPLDFALVLPMSTPVTVNTRARTPGPALAALRPSQAAALEQLVGVLHAAPTVPVTLDASAQALEGLERSGSAGRTSVAALSGLSQDQSVDEVPPAPYVPIDVAALGGAGESTELQAQMAAGATVLHALRVQTAPERPWVASAVGKGLGAGLSEVGATQVVVQDTSLAPTPTAPSYTWASTFDLSLPTSPSRTLQAAETDSFLDGQFRDAAADPALSATQVLADLAMVHFEEPYATAVRGMIAVPPSGWAPNGAFVRTLLAGLKGNPVVSPVTLSRFFSTVSAAGDRTLQSGAGSPPLRRSLARSLSAARVHLTQFGQSVRGQPPVLSQLDHLLLGTESTALTDRSRAAAVASFDRVLSHQLKKVSFANAGTFTLTARTGVIPITVVSRADYTIVGTVSVSGAKFTFPGATTQVMTLDHQTNSWRVSLLARSSGDLPLDVTFTSQSGLVFAQEQIMVRSTATSLVGVLLTALALAVLLAWWARTWRAKRRGRRDADSEAAEHGGRTPVSVA